MLPTLVELNRVHKTHTTGPAAVRVLKNVDFSVSRGEFVAVMGPSGSGKSTLLHILGCLDLPDDGRYFFDGQDVLTSTDPELSRIRAHSIGFVFQTFNLIHNLDVFENVELPFLYSLKSTRDCRARINSAVDRVGLSNRITHKPLQLSGGEMQRAAIARAIAVDPKLILADEPTGNLDTATGLEILELFKALNSGGMTIVMVTHNPDVAAYADRVMVLKDGRFAQ